MNDVKDFYSVFQFVWTSIVVFQFVWTLIVFQFVWTFIVFFSFDGLL